MCGGSLAVMSWTLGKSRLLARDPFGCEAVLPSSVALTSHPDVAHCID